MFDKASAYIVYDGDCPFCSQYVRLLRLREAAGTVVLVNAREEHPIVRFVEQQGVVLDREMALILGGRLYSGAECMHRLALLSTPSGLFNRFNALAFSSGRVSAIAYPVLRFLRGVTLRALGRSRIRPR